MPVVQSGWDPARPQVPVQGSPSQSPPSGTQVSGKLFKVAEIEIVAMQPGGTGPSGGGAIGCTLCTQPEHSSGAEKELNAITIPTAIANRRGLIPTSNDVRAFMIGSLNVVNEVTHRK